MKANRVIIAAIVMLLLFTSLACNLNDNTSTNVATSTPTPVADSIEGCYDRAYTECMDGGTRTAALCKDFADVTCGED